MKLAIVLIVILDLG